MKKVLLLLTLLSTLTASAATNIDGINYDLNSSDNTAEVTRGGNYTGSVSIPATITYNDVSYSVTSIGTHAFYYCSGLTSVTIPNSVTEIGDFGFIGCTGLTSLTIGNSVTSIGMAAFSDCSGLTSVTIPNSVTSIGGSAFYACFGLTSVTIPNSVTSIGNSAFSSCSKLTSIEIPNSVTSIGDWSFYGCTGLTSVTIPNSVTSIGNSVFSYCPSLTDVYCYAENVPSMGSDVFTSPEIEDATLYVPAASVEAYKATYPWSEFGYIVAIPGTAVRGDVNEDGKVNGTDIQAVINAIVAGEYNEKADINQDGNVNGTDIQEVINIIVNGNDKEEDIKLEKAGVRFGFYETIPGYSVKINKINITGLGVAEFGSDIIGSTIGTSTVTRTLDRADGNFTNVYFKDANEDTEMVVEVDFTLVADDGSGETINQKATTTVKLQDLIQWQSNRNYTFIYKILLAPLYMTEDVVPAIYFDSVVVDGQEGTTR